MQTRNYDAFSYFDENRKVNKTHVRELVESISKNNLLDANPVIVNGAMEVIDGQHRIAACKILGIPVPYVIKNHTSINDVILLNTKQRSWSLTDYVNSYARQGMADYQVLLDFAHQYKLPLSTSAIVLGGQRVVSDSVVVKNGKFKVNSVSFAIKVVDFVHKISAYVEPHILVHSKFYIAVMKILNNPVVKTDKLISKFSMLKEKPNRMATIQLYMRQLEEIYNFHSKEKVRLF